MLLCVDIGNTNIALGIYEDESLGARWRVATDHERMPDEYGIQLLGLLSYAGIFAESITGGIVASVVPHLTERWVKVFERYLSIDALVVDSKMKTGIKILYEEPQTIGADRIVDAVAAYRQFGGPACIVDFGTATTFDALTKNGEYLGGAITPGIQIAAEALFHRTAKLPRVELAPPPSAIGRNTIHAMQSGLLFGYVSLVEGMVERFRKELGEEMKVIATGGLSELVSKETKIIQHVAPWLTLDGLKMLYDKNRKSG
jgi:type III pantothenate kinase